jgi:hypothetical protein
MGMIVRNVIHWPEVFLPEITFCVAKLLCLGIMFLGIRLSILAVAKIGAGLSTEFTKLKTALDEAVFYRAFGSHDCGRCQLSAGHPLSGSHPESYPVLNSGREDTPIPFLIDS